MSYFFNGREVITPSTMSAVNDSALANTNLSVGNVTAYIGVATGGQPGVPLSFGSPSEAQAVLRSGEMLTAVMKAFNASNETGGPASVTAMRVNPAVQAALTLVDAHNNPVIDVTSADWGQYTNQIKLTLGAGSVKGMKASVALGAVVYSADNLYSAPFEVQYTGAQVSGVISVSPTTVTLEAPIGTATAIDLATFPTVQQLVDKINSVAGFTAVVNGGAANASTLNGLDNLLSQDILTAAYNVTANLQAVASWLNSASQPFVTAEVVAGAGTLPVVIPYTYLTGGSDGLTTTTNYSEALTALQSVDIQWLTPISPDPTVWAMVDAHVQYMSTIGRMERRSIVGMALGSSDADAIAAAFDLNSDRTSLVHIGYYDTDIQGVLPGLQLLSPYMTAAAIAGAFSGVSPGTPMTNKAMTFQGLERLLLNPTDTDPLITAGVLCVDKEKTGYMVVQSISTWLVNKNYDKREQSVGWALDFTSRNVRDALDPLRGQKNNAITLGQAATKTESALRLLAVPDPQGPGVLAGDAANPPYKNIVASAVGDAIAVSFQCSPVLPANYIAVTIYAVPYTGTATAS